MSGLQFTAQQGTSNSIQPLAPWNIHNVQFKGIEHAEFKGKTNDTQYHVMKVKFANEDGVFEHSVFMPKLEDANRKMNENSGKEMPSNWDNFQFLISHLGERLAPEVWEKNKSKLAFDVTTLEGFKKFIGALSQILKGALDKEFPLKLIGDKQNRSRLPYYVALNKNGEAFISNNFLGEKLFFSDFEISQKTKIQNTKPTTMNATTNDLDIPDNSDLSSVADDLNDMDFEID